MSITIAPCCPYCSAPLTNQAVSTKGFTKALYTCGTVLGYFRQHQGVPLRSEGCRKNEARAKPARAK